MLRSLRERYTNFRWVLVQEVLIFNWNVSKGPMVETASGWTSDCVMERTCRCGDHVGRETRAWKSQFSSKNG